MKEIKRTILFQVLILLVCIQQAPGASVNDLTYEVENNEVIIKACNRDAVGSLIVPETIEGLPVTTIDFQYISDDSIIFAQGAFEDCDLLTSIVVPHTVTTINDGAFRKCDLLATITLGRGVSHIGEGVFGDCASLISISVNEENLNYESIDGVLYDESEMRLIAFPGGKGGSYLVGNTVRSIASDAFYGCHTLTELVLSNTILTIGDRAFKGCESLMSLELPEGLTELGYLAFQDCVSLKNAVIPASLTHLPTGSFWGCTSLDSFAVPDTIETMGHSVFRDCSNLISVTLSEQLTTIEESTFDNCDALQVFAIPDKIIEIGVSAFRDCDSLLEINIPATVIDIEYAAFDRCDALQRIDVDSANPNYSSLDGVFYNADGTEIINFPGGRGGLFRIPDGVTTIDIAAFAECKQLNHLILPATLTLIESFAFNDCESLRRVVFLGDLPTIQTHTRWWEDPVVIVGAFDGANLELEFYLYEDAYGTHRSMIEAYPVRFLPLEEDYDHDGFSNAVERVLGTSPANSSSRLSAWLEGDRLRFSDIREAVSIELFWSHNLSEWNELTIEPSGRPDDAGFNLPPLDVAPFNLSDGHPLFFKVSAETGG